MHILQHTQRLKVTYEGDIDRAKIISVSPCGIEEEIAVIHEVSSDTGVQFHFTVSIDMVARILAIANQLHYGAVAKEYRVEFNET